MMTINFTVSAIDIPAITSILDANTIFHQHEPIGPGSDRHEITCYSSDFIDLVTIAAMLFAFGYATFPPRPGIPAITTGKTPNKY